MDDARALTAAIASGDADAFARFYTARFNHVYALARRFTSLDEAHCLDIVQDAMLRVIRSMKPLPNEDALGAWLARVTRAAAIDHVRAERRRRARELRAFVRRPAPAADAPEGERAEQLDWLRAELTRLDEVSSQLLAMRYGAGATLDEAGRTVGLRPAAAHARIGRVLARLRRAGGGGEAP